MSLVASGFRQRAVRSLPASPFPATPETPTLDTVPIPEPFRTALSAGKAADVCGAEAPTAEALFGRGCARAAVGLEEEARADFEAALPDLGDPCRVELALLGLREQKKLGGTIDELAAIVARAKSGSPLQARAIHAAGLAEFKRRRTPAAIGHLLRASEAYGVLEDQLRRAQVYDTLGNVQAASGDLESALQSFALSLVDKCLLGDRAGMAITLGSLGRLHLRAGRFVDALECFRRDLKISHEIGDDRGRARMFNDLARVHLAEARPQEAMQCLLQGLEIARARNYPDIRFFLHKDLALALLALGKVDAAEREMDEAASFMPRSDESYFTLVLDAARAEIFLNRNDTRAPALLQEVVTGFTEADLPDLEIPARVSLARCLATSNLKAKAEVCLLAGLRRARSRGFQRYIPLLNEAMTALAAVESAVEESGRRLATDAAPATTDYVLRESLGKGAFGEVFRAYDPRRACEVAFKRIDLGRIYNVSTRNRLMSSARVELEAASRVRHPGVCGVLAVGTEPSGALYIVQEFIRGTTLRGRMADTSNGEPSDVMSMLVKIADALSALHAAGVVHRDLKPENVLLRPDWSPVLVDFGIAFVAGGSFDPGADNLVGTLEYMSPEQAAGKSVDARSDLYSLGVMAYEWLTGVRPLRLRGNSLTENILDLRTREPAPLRDLRPGVTRAVEQVVMELLSKSPRRRPPDAATLAVRLSRFSGREAPG